MTPAEQRVEHPLIAHAPNVALNTALWRFWRRVLMPVTIACAAIAGAHWAHRQVLNPPGAQRRPLTPKGPWSVTRDRERREVS